MKQAYDILADPQKREVYDQYVSRVRIPWSRARIMTYCDGLSTERAKTASSSWRTTAT